MTTATSRRRGWAEPRRSVPPKPLTGRLASTWRVTAINAWKLRIADVLTENGAETVAESPEPLAGLDVGGDQAPFDGQAGHIADDLRDAPLFSVSIRLTEPPYGYVVRPFGVPTARNTATHTTGSKVTGDSLAVVPDSRVNVTDPGPSSGATSSSSRTRGRS